MKFVSAEIPKKMWKDPIFTHKFHLKTTYKSFALSRCMEKFRFESAWGSKVFFTFTREYGRDLQVIHTGTSLQHPMSTVLSARKWGKQNVIFESSGLLSGNSVGPMNIHRRYRSEFHVWNEDDLQTERFPFEIHRNVQKGEKNSSVYSISLG